MHNRPSLALEAVRVGVLSSPGTWAHGLKARFCQVEQTPLLLFKTPHEGLQGAPAGGHLEARAGSYWPGARYAGLFLLASSISSIVISGVVRTVSAPLAFRVSAKATVDA